MGEKYFQQEFDMTEENKKPEAYYMGKHFDTVDEMIAFAQKLAKKAVSEENLKWLADELVRNIWVNCEMNEKKITNAEARDVFEEMFCIFLMKIHEKYKKK